MVDTLVLGTSANAWEFESLHAQIKDITGVFFVVDSNYIFCCWQNIWSFTLRASCLVGLVLLAYDARESLHAQIKDTLHGCLFVYFFTYLYKIYFYEIIHIRLIRDRGLLFYERIYSKGYYF